MEVAATALSPAGTRSLVQCLFDDAKEPMVIVDLETLSIRDANQAAEHFTGRARTHLLNRPLPSLFVENKARDEVLQILLTDEVQSGELYLRRRDRAALPSRLTIRRIESEQGTLGLIAFHAGGQQEDHPSDDSESRYRSLVQNAPVCIHEIDRTGRLLSINPAGLRMIDATAEEILGVRYLDVVEQPDRSRVAELWQAALQGMAVNFEFTAKVKGTRRVFASNFIPILGSQGNVEKVMGVSQDITARKQVEQALRHSETSLRKAQEIAQLGSWQLDFNTGHLTGSAETYRMLGIDRTDQSASWLASGLAKFVHPDDQDLVLDAVRKAIATGEAPPLEFRHLTPAGGIRHLRAVAELIQDPQDGYQGIFGTLQDITERKETELALRESETRFRVIAEHCPAMVAIFQEGKIRFVNDRVTQLLGYSRDALLGQDFSMLVHPEHRDIVRERNVRRLRGEDVPCRYEFKLQTKQGDVCWIDFTAGLFEYEGEPAVLGIAVDVTERRSTEERLRQKEIELAHVARLTTMGEMVAGIAHEINQPLSAISNFADACTAELSKLDAPQVPRIKRWSELIGQQAVRCGDIIRRLRGYVKQKRLDDTAIQINEVIQESIALLRNEIHQSVITVQYELLEPSPVVAGNSVELQQVMVNLLANAYEAIKRSKLPQGELFIRTHCAANCLQIDVEDNGPGIRENELDRIYEAFFTTKSDGMGMGLAISHSIVERHGGRLWANNREPHGAAFHIELPRKTGARCVVR